MCARKVGESKRRSSLKRAHSLPHAGLAGSFVNSVNVNLPTGVPGKTSPVTYSVCSLCSDKFGNKCATCTLLKCLTCKPPAKLVGTACQ